MDQLNLIEADNFDAFFPPCPSPGCISGKTSVVRKRKWLLRASLLRCGRWGCSDTWSLYRIATRKTGMIYSNWIQLIYYILCMYWSFILIIHMKLIWQMYQDSVSVWHWSLNTGGFHSSQSLYTEFEDGSWETRFSYVHELLGVGNLSGIRWCANHKGVVSIWRSVRFLN